MKNIGGILSRLMRNVLSFIGYKGDHLYELQKEMTKMASTGNKCDGKARTTQLENINKKIKSLVYSKRKIETIHAILRDTLIFSTTMFRAHEESKNKNFHDKVSKLLYKAVVELCKGVDDCTTDMFESTFHEITMPADEIMLSTEINHNVLIISDEAYHKAIKLAVEKSKYNITIISCLHELDGHDTNFALVALNDSELINTYLDVSDENMPILEFKKAAIGTERIEEFIMKKMTLDQAGKVLIVQWSRRYTKIVGVHTQGIEIDDNHFTIYDKIIFSQPYSKIMFYESTSTETDLIKIKRLLELFDGVLVLVSFFSPMRHPLVGELAREGVNLKRIIYDQRSPYEQQKRRKWNHQ